ncbi:hypothetical protein ANN_08777 [Periplaneta americana]|uniref:Histone-lysine N-methyltransferase SETMAR n=1 Tax=Periplaneta americana TaxID=6978 RepID=A0ABQ8T417_PERAM|nr:hypothetical protein ANN_08777 [Periplaneta americana]
MEHPAYSPDLALSDFHLFGPPKEALGGGRSFVSDEDVKSAVHQWLCVQPKTFYSDGIKKLVGCWEKYIEKLGDYKEFKKVYQKRINVIKDENGDLLADSHPILNRWKNYFGQLRGSFRK